MAADLQNHPQRKKTLQKKLTQIISYVQFTAVAWNISKQLILHPQAGAFFPPLPLLYRRRSTVWSTQGFPALQWQNWKRVWGPARQHHAWPQGPLALFLLHPPKASSPQKQAPKILGTLCGAQQILAWGRRRTESEVSFPAAFPKELVTHWCFYPPWKYICYHRPSPSPSPASPSLLNSAHTRPGGAFLLLSVSFEIGLSNLWGQFILPLLSINNVSIRTEQIM